MVYNKRNVDNLLVIYYIVVRILKLMDVCVWFLMRILRLKWEYDF